MEDAGKELDHPSSEDTYASEESSNTSESDTTAKQMARAEKARAIRKACARRDVEALAVHATSEGGLLEDDLRQMACEYIFWFKEGEHTIWTQLTGGQGLFCYVATNKYDSPKRPQVLNFYDMPMKNR